jgi:hypothetical protein
MDLSPTSSVGKAQKTTLPTNHHQPPSQKTSSSRQKASSRFHLTQTKLNVVKNLAEYFCLSVKDLSILIYRKHDEITTTSVNRTLRLLEAEGYVEWRQLTTRLRKTGNLPLIYGLTQKAVDLAAEEGLVTPATKVFKPNSDVPGS